MSKGFWASGALSVMLLALPRWLQAAPAEISFPSQARVEEETAGYSVLEVKFPSSEHSVLAADNTVWGHLYLPRQRSGAHPPACVLVLPVLAAPNVFIEMRFVHALVRGGMAVMWIELPYQFHRRPGDLVPTGQVFLARTAKRLGWNFRQAVADARRSITWLKSSGKVDSERIGILGVSLGALVGSAEISTDLRPRAAVFLLGGADFSDLIMRGSMTSGFARKAGIRQEELRQAWAGLDPLDHREANRGKRILLINGRCDNVIPEYNARKLKEAFPDAVQRWVPFGHYGAIIHLVWIPTYVAWWFNKNLR